MSEPYVGEIRMFGGTFAPRGWLFCEGQIVPIAQYDALFSLIGTTYGGDGSTTFALPDLRGRVPLHHGTDQSSGRTYRLGSMGGTETVTLTQDQLPSHTHLPSGSATTADQTGPSQHLFAEGGAQLYTDNAGTESMSPKAVATAGGSQAHENVAPFQCVAFIIATYGIYPPRS